MSLRRGWCGLRVASTMPKDLVALNLEFYYSLRAPLPSIHTQGFFYIGCPGECRPWSSFKCGNLASVTRWIRLFREVNLQQLGHEFMRQLEVLRFWHYSQKEWECFRTRTYARIAINHETVWTGKGAPYIECGNREIVNAEKQLELGEVFPP